MSKPTLLFVPTALELRRLEDLGGVPPGHALCYLVGFGPVAAAARAAALIERLSPRRALLLGIAGAYDTGTHPVGSALCFDEVGLFGVGAGEGKAFLGPPALGFPQWPAEGSAPAIEDRLPLVRPASAATAPLLLTTTAASATPEQAAERRRRFPGASAEDMEGFAVAFACQLARVPLCIVRGISNRVGDRDPAAWNIPLALTGALELANAVLADEDWQGAGS